MSATAFVAAAKDHHIATFGRLAGDLERGSEGLLPLRRAAIERFGVIGFPTTRDEDWKYTSVAALSRIPFVPSLVAPAGLDPKVVAKFGLAELAQRRLVFVDGLFVAELSSIPELGGGACVASLAHLLASPSRPDYLTRSLAQVVQPLKAFPALNTAFMRDGACLHVPRGVVVDQPIEILFIAVGSTDGPVACHPRNLYIVEQAGSAEVIETYVDLGEGTQHFTNAVSEVVLGRDGSFRHTKIQDESDRAFHVATLAAHCGRDSRFASRSYSFGAALSRHDIDVTQMDTGFDCSLDGLFLAAGRQHVDHHTLVDHARPHGSSRELYKGILDDHAVGVFNGKVMVRPDAQKTDARQSSRNLLLSANAVIETKPELEIFADDVKCAHGATVGQLDEAARFYLQSRGIGPDEARAILIFAFASELVSGVGFEPLRRRLHELISTRLPGATALEEGR